MRIPFTKSTMVIVGAVLAAHCALMSYAIYSTKAKSETPPENTSLVFVDIPTEPTGPTESHTVAEQAAGKSEPQKRTKQKNVTPPKNQPKQPVVKKDKAPPVKTTQTKTASNDVAATTKAQNTQPDTSTSQNTATNTQSSQSNNTGKGNAAGAGTGSSSSSTPAGGGGNSNTVVNGGTVNIAGKYPPRAIEDDASGTVRVSLTVMPNGSITNVKLVKPNKNRYLNNSALAAAQNANVKPKTINGQSVATNYVVNVSYKLK